MMNTTGKPFGKGKLFGVGVGPGDPELITLKGLKALETADIIAFHQAKGKTSNALAAAERWLEDHQERLPIVYPVTTEILPPDQDYESILAGFYEQTEQALRCRLEAGKTVAVLAEGDPLFYSSFMYIYNRLAQAFETTIIPGVTSVAAAAAAAGTPLCYRNQAFTVLPGVLDGKTLESHLSTGQAFAIMKVGRNLEKIRRAVRNAGFLERALYIERATMAGQRIEPLCEVTGTSSPYFSLVLIPATPWKS